MQSHKQQLLQTWLKISNNINVKVSSTKDGEQVPCLNWQLYARNCDTYWVYEVIMSTWKRL